METNKKKKITDKLREKYRLVIMNDSTFEEKLSFRLSRMNVFVAVGTLSIVLVFLTTYLIAFTPLKEFIPDYASDVRMKYDFYDLSLKTDSLEKQLALRDKYLMMLKQVIEGKVQSKEDLAKLAEDTVLPADYSNVKDEISEDEKEFREKVEAADQYTLSRSKKRKPRTTGISGVSFYSPLKGVISNRFNPQEKHYGVDIAAKLKEPVKATLDGTVLFSDWSIETGYVIAIQHAGNMVSIYKHNNALFKKQGESVKAGEPIGIIGNTGRMSTGPHLHFELWYNGIPVNPTEYMTF